jgi:hypothetical protein
MREVFSVGERDSERIIFFQTNSSEAEVRVADIYINPISACELGFVICGLY